MKKILLKAWRCGNFIANVNENDNDIVLEIKYSDHGDDFLLIKDNNKNIYHYGLFVNRPGYGHSDDNFIIKPKIFCKGYLRKHIEDLYYSEDVDNLSKEDDNIKGICGKEKYWLSKIAFDEIEYIKYNGKLLDLHDVNMEVESTDDCGYDTMSLELDGFN